MLVLVIVVCLAGMWWTQANKEPRAGEFETAPGAAERYRSDSNIVLWLFALLILAALAFAG